MLPIARFVSPHIGYNGMQRCHLDSPAGRRCQRHQGRWAAPSAAPPARRAGQHRRLGRYASRHLCRCFPATVSRALSIQGLHRVSTGSWHAIRMLLDCILQAAGAAPQQPAGGPRSARRAAHAGPDVALPRCARVPACSRCSGVCRTVVQPLSGYPHGTVATAPQARKQASAFTRRRVTRQDCLH